MEPLKLISRAPGAVSQPWRLLLKLLAFALAVPPLFSTGRGVLAWTLAGAVMINLVLAHV